MVNSSVVEIDGEGGRLPNRMKSGNLQADLKTSKKSVEQPPCWDGLKTSTGMSDIFNLCGVSDRCKGTVGNSHGVTDKVLLL